ncbi:amidohydrolase family protein [Oscillospiraceae bacterium 44-34]
MLAHGKYAITDPSAPMAGFREETALRIQDGVITELGSWKDLRARYPDEPAVGNGRQLLMPGLIDAHTHGAGLSYAQRGVRLDYLENSLLDFATALQLPPELTAMMNAVRHIRNGCTTIHHNESGAALDPALAETSRRKIAGYRKTGIRLGYSMGIRNRNTLALEDEAFLETLPEDLRLQAESRVHYDKKAAADQYLDAFDEVFRTENHGCVRVFLGPNWVQGSTDELLLRVKERSDSLGKLPIHLHCLQTPVQKAFGLRNYGKSLVGHLDDLGLVDSNLVLGHAVYLSQDDIQLLGNRHASVTHHPSCNLIMRNGIAPVYEMLRSGINVALGIDEKGINDDEDPIMEMRMIYYLHRCPGTDLSSLPAVSPETVLQIATLNGAAPSGFAAQVGALRPGMAADLILVDMDDILNEPWVSPDAPIPWLFVRRALGRHVNTVIIGGKIIMEERNIKTIDLEALYDQVRQAASLGRMPKQLENEAFLQRIKPYYQAWYNAWLKDLEFEPYYFFNSRQ